MNATAITHPANCECTYPEDHAGAIRLDALLRGLCECGLRHPIDTNCADEWAAEDERRRADDDRDWHELRDFEESW